MKKSLFIRITLGIVITFFAVSNLFAQQVPQGINYQAVLRRADGTIMSNKNNVTLEFSIHRTTINGTVDYKENWNLISTNKFGLVNLQIGLGTPVTNSFTDVHWGTYSYFLQVRVDTTGLGGLNFVDLGTTQFISVPYALVADTVLHGGGGVTYTGGNGINVNGTIITNTLPDQTVSLTGTGGTSVTGTYPNFNINSSTGGTGTVTSVGTGAGLTGGPINISGTIALANTTVTPSTYGSAGKYPRFTVNAQGQLTAADSLPLPTTLPPNGAASGDLGNNYPNPIVTGLQGHSISNTTPAPNQVLSYIGNIWTPTTIPLSSGWGLTGNNGTVPGTNFIGTIDNYHLDIRTNNLLKVRVTTKGQIETYNTGNSVFIGKASGENDDLSSNKNVFIGDSVGFSNTIGSDNTAIGYNSLKLNSTGYNNCSLGSGTLANNSTGGQNVGIGNQALYNNSTGGSNIAIGDMALDQNLSGFNNTAIGSQSMWGNISGIDNVGLGAGTLIQSTGDDNVAIGSASLNGNTSGSYNTAIGEFSGYANFGNVTGNNNTFLGYQTGANAGGYNNSTAIGNGAVINANDQIRLGNSAVNAIVGTVPYTTSDKRFKTNIKDNVTGLDFIMELKPVSYNFEYQKFSKFLGEKSVDVNVLRKKEAQIEIGFIAQDVEATCNKLGINVSNIFHAPESDKDNYSIAYGELVVPLVKGMQEQQAQIDELKKQVVALQALINKQQTNNK